MDEVPFEDRIIPQVEVEWERSLWWWRPLTRAIQPAIRMTSLVFGLLAMVLSWCGLELAETIFGPRWIAEPEFTVPVAEASWTALPEVGRWFAGLIITVLSFQEFGLRELAFSAFCALWFSAVFSFFGGVLCKRAAVELGQQTVGSWLEIIASTCTCLPSFLWLTAMHFVALVGLLAPFYLLGMLAQLGGTFATVAGVLMLICFVLIFAVGRTILSMIACFPMGVAAICIEEKSDAFEGFARSNAYFFQRPFVVFVSTAFLLIGGLIGEQIVLWVIYSGWWIARQTFLAGGATSPEVANYVASGNWLSGSLVAAFWFSYFWASTAAVYLVARRSVDNTELDEISMAESADTAELPELPNAGLGESS